MSLLLAPYNNAMRIGQGFNSYTQQICIDDAVVMDPNREDNIINNTGLTMKAQAENFRRSVEEGPVENVEDRQLTSSERKALQSKTFARGTPEEKRAVTKEEIEADMQRQRDALEKYRAEAAEAKLSGKTLTAPEPKLLTEAETEAKIRGEEAALKATSVDAHPEASAWNEPTRPLAEDKLQSGKAYHFIERDSPSQTVIYSSRFVSKISEITDDMNISGSLSIKYGTIGGSGRGSFIDASKFAESDLNFYISVKVINQSINFKDSLVYKPLSGSRDLGDKFKDIYGDSFVSGFLEGGEFNGLVSMKVLNQAKKTDIAAAAKVALTAGVAEVSAEAQVDIAKQNLHENAETTIQVSWSGGGHIKPRDEPWTIETLMAAAARFPDLVARTPQRTYAILTKYESLRSFQENLPENFTPLQYENANLYTNSLLDSYMEYKSLYRQLADEILELNEGTRRFIHTDSSEDEEQIDGEDTGLSENVESGPFDAFPATVAAINRARIQIRKEMSKIVSEVDEVAKDPRRAQRTDTPLPFQTPVTFKKRLPKTDLKNPASDFLLMSAKDIKSGVLPKDMELYPREGTALSERSRAMYERILKMDPRHPIFFRMDQLTGSENGDVFNDLEVLRAEFTIQEVEVQLFKGAVNFLKVSYSNGVVVQHGRSRDTYNAKSVRLALSRQRNEKIMACWIEAGIPKSYKKLNGDWEDYPTGGEGEGQAQNKHVITQVKLYTNRGQTLNGEPIGAKVARAGEAERDGVKFVDLNGIEYDPMLPGGDVRGFWGYSQNLETDDDFVYALAPVWGAIHAQ